MHDLTPSQADALEATERAFSSLSITASVFVILSFLGSNLFHTPVNRLVFYATFGNILGDVAIIAGRTGLESDEDGALCQWQAFFIQWFRFTPRAQPVFVDGYAYQPSFHLHRFILADPLWTLAMAVNVYLTLFRRYTTYELKRLEWIYFIICYGLPGIVPIVLVPISTEDRGKIFGRAVLWCSIRPEWDFLRIALFYGPVWFTIAVVSAIYLYAGREVLASRRRLKQLGSSTLVMPNGDPGAAETWQLQQQPQPAPPTQIDSAATAAEAGGNNGQADRRQGEPSGNASSSEEHSPICNGTGGNEGDSGQVTGNVPETSSGHGSTASGAGSSGEEPPTQQAINGLMRGQDSEDTVIANNENGIKLLGADTGESAVRTPSAAGEPSPVQDSSPSPDQRPEWDRRIVPDPEPGQVRFQPPTDRSLNGGPGTSPLRYQPAYERNSAAYVYAKRAILFFLSIFITWVPPSVNRIYLLTRRQHPNFGMAFAASVVLPLQGFWNALIYIATSWGPVKTMFRMIFEFFKYRLFRRGSERGRVARGRKGETPPQPGRLRRMSAALRQRSVAITQRPSRRPHLSRSAPEGQVGGAGSDETVTAERTRDEDVRA